MNTGPIFVVGMNGSGTTMLADSLGRHPHIYSMPQESKVLPYYLQHYGHAGALDTLEGSSRTLANGRPISMRGPCRTSNASPA